jgi:hypothetical protein
VLFRSYAGQLYTDNLKKQIYEYLLSLINEKPEFVKEWLASFIKERTRQILKGYFVGRSTGTFHNIAHAFDKEVDCQLIEKYSLFLDWISEEKNPMPII